MAAVNLIGSGPFVQAALATLLEFKMLHCVGNIGLSTVDAGIDKRLGEHTASWANKWSATPVFLIPGLLSDQQQSGPRRTFARHDLCRVPVERTTLARRFGIAQSF